MRTQLIALGSVVGVLVVGCDPSSSGDDGSVGACEEYLDSTLLLPAYCGPGASHWEDFDDTCVVPSFELTVEDAQGNIVVHEEPPQTQGYLVGLPAVAGAYNVSVLAPGFEPFEAAVCVTEYENCHVTEHFCDEPVDVTDTSSHKKPWLLLNLTPSDDAETTRE